MHEASEMQSAWTQLWKTGQVESLREDRAAGMLGSLDCAWTEFLAQLPDGARLLDLATGGGDLVRRAISVDRSFKATGVDIADLSAVAATFPNADVALIGNTDLCHLPFADSVFDGVMSQFGIEYADIIAATREAVRVLKSGGRGQFVLHHKGSGVTRGTINSIAADLAVFNECNAFQCGRTAFELRKTSASRERCCEAEAEFRKAVGVLQSRLRDERAFDPARRVVLFLAHLAAAPAQHEAAEALHQIDEVEKDAEARMLRKLAQINAALDSKGIEEVAERLLSAGALVGVPQELRYPGGRILGWKLDFQKQPPGRAMPDT